MCENDIYATLRIKIRCNTVFQFTALDSTKKFETVFSPWMCLLLLEWYMVQYEWEWTESSDIFLHVQTVVRNYLSGCARVTFGNEFSTALW